MDYRDNSTRRLYEDKAAVLKTRDHSAKLARRIDLSYCNTENYIQIFDKLYFN